MLGIMKGLVENWNIFALNCTWKIQKQKQIVPLFENVEDEEQKFFWLLKMFTIIPLYEFLVYLKR